MPPKSAGRDTFDLSWLTQHLAGNEPAADVQATLLALSAKSIANAVEGYCGEVNEIYACGGGARNEALLELLKQELNNVAIATTDALGVPAEHVEALAFAWLARRTLDRQPGNVPSVTGASRLRVLGAIYPGR